MEDPRTLRTKTGYVCPVVNLNGSSASMLLEDYGNFGKAIRNAISLAYECTPHPRDYQLCPVGAFEAAYNEHRDRIRRLSTVLDEIESICETIIDQGRK